jgi:AraC-like DNA-binding protein
VANLHGAINENDREFLVFNASNGLADNSLQAIRCTYTGRMIIAAQGNLNFYDGGSFTHINTHRDFELALTNYEGGCQLYFDRYHHLWVKNLHTVTCVDLYMERFSNEPQQIVSEMGCKETVLDLFTDSIGDVWFLTPNGLYDVQTKQTTPILAGNSLQHVDTYKQLLVAFYANGEVMATDRQTNTNVKCLQNNCIDVSSYPKLVRTIRSDSVFFFIRRGEVGSVLYSLNVKTWEWHKLIEEPYAMSAVTLHEGLLYVSTEHGYFTCNPQGEQQQFFETLRLSKERTMKPRCNDLCFDRQGGLWLVTDARGLLFGRPRTSPIKVHSLNSPLGREYAEMLAPLRSNIKEYQGQRASYRYEDSRGWTWYCTITGLYMCRQIGEKRDTVVYDWHNGLLNNVIHSIIEDHDHNIWVGTSYGVACIVFENNEPVFVNCYNAFDKVPDESFLDGKAMMLNDGTIIMQTTDHVVSFNPDNFTTTVKNRRSSKLTPKLIKLLVNGNFVEGRQTIDGNVIIDRCITRAKHIYLNSDQNSISLTFSGLNYFRPMQTCYRVRVSGLSDQANKWRIYTYFNGKGYVDSKGLLHLPMVGLKPGTYEIEVQASMFPDVWDENPKTRFIWYIHVNQPWWQTTAVYLVFALIILGMLITNTVVYSRNVRIRAKVNAKEVFVMKRINSFLERCKACDKILMAPDEGVLLGEKRESEPEEEFVEMFVRLIPYLKKNMNHLSLCRLSEKSGLDINKFHQLFLANLYKSPRTIIMRIRLEKAAQLLTTTQKTIDEIAVECKFCSTNYFIGNFYHHFKATPEEYRRKKQSA